MTFTPAEVIEVSAWGRLVGAVARDPATGLYAFEYDDGWLEEGAELLVPAPPASARRLRVPELRRQTFHALPAMLADALPDRFGSALVNAWMAEQGIDPASITALDRLAYAGDRALGALTFAPPTGPPSGEVSLVQVADLVTAARAELTGTLDEGGAHEALAQLITVGSSAGGARAKAVIAYNPETDQMRSGQLNAPRGVRAVDPQARRRRRPDRSGQATRWPRASPTAASSSPTTSWRRRAGVVMSESRLLPEGPRAHFMTRRFDRGPETSASTCSRSARSLTSTTT